MSKSRINGKNSNIVPRSQHGTPGSNMVWTNEAVSEADFMVFRDAATNKIVNVVAPNGLQVGLFDENFQCKISATDGSANDKSERNEFNVCSYVLLSSEPTLIHDLSKHSKWKDHPEIISGNSKYLGYAGFPVINKDNYALGTLCLLNGEPSSLTNRQIELIKSLAERIAHQIDLQTDQKETTSDSMHQAIKKFTNRVSVNDLDLLNKFLNVCSGIIIAEEELEHLK